jgi:RecJ-like exonuclease
MAACIICGTTVDGHICETHQEDVAFDFKGNRSGQLVPDRFYKGTVDGYAEFGVFIDLSARVTGLLHRSKLDQRLESLDWEVGDTVYVQVTNIRDNGDVDLGWSIRQSDGDFRGVLIQDPDGNRLPDSEDPDEDQASSAEKSHQEHTPTPEETEVVSEQSETESAPTETEQQDSGDSDSTAANHDGHQTTTTTERERHAPEDVDRVAVDSARAHVGETVRLEGEIVSARQTSGPTVFELRDETGVVDCAAFVEAGVRAYPEVEVDALVRLTGEVRLRREELQIETDTMDMLEAADREAVERRIESAAEAAADPGEVEALVADPAVESSLDAVRAVCQSVRRAINESRPIIVRHSADTDGYVAGAAIERAVLPLVEAEHAGGDAVYHYFDRRPLDGSVYELDDATKDVTRMLGDRERHDEKLPLFLFTGAGGNRESIDGLELLGVYEAERIVLGVADAGAMEEAAVEATVSTDKPRTAATLAATVGAGINPDVAEQLHHLPAISYWEGTPTAYETAAREAGVDPDATRQLRQAVALEAYYQSYEDKRELITDLLFDRQRGLAEQISTQFSEKLDAELETARENVELRREEGVTFQLLDTDAYTNRFDFPPTALLLDELHRAEASGEAMVVGMGRDELVVRSNAGIDLHAVAQRVDERVPAGGVSSRGSDEGVVSFLAGERETVVDTMLEELAVESSAAAAV